MQASIVTAKIAELAMVVERAKRASEKAMQLADEYRFIVTWYGMRPHSRLRPDPMLDDEPDRITQAVPD
jgi:hypothetical protein